MSRGVVSERYRLKKLSESELAISIADVAFEDAGNYTCYEYGHRVTERKVELTVIGEDDGAVPRGRVGATVTDPRRNDCRLLVQWFQGPPKITQRRHRGRFDLKCTARASDLPPQIIWKLDDGPEILGNFHSFCPPAFDWFFQS